MDVEAAGPRACRDKWKGFEMSEFGFMADFGVI
jgi:hypothetical protein